MRRAQVAGQFYPSNAEVLRKQIDNLLSNLDVSAIKLEGNKNIRAVIVPHAGYIFSGKCAAFAYRLFSKEKVDTFIILGTNHSGLGSKISLSVEDFETPLGVVETDILVIEKMIKKAEGSNIDLTVDEKAHKYEHSIEVQLPFIQSISKSRIVACLLRDMEEKDAHIFGKIISDIVKEKGKKIVVLASSDFTHYGPSYNFLPFQDNVKQNIQNLDNKVIEKILNLDVSGFFQETRKSTICGKDAISVLIETSRNLNLKAEKLCYSTSGDVTEDWKNVVGYASIAFY
jgi:MEMO1 family protein